MLQPGDPYASAFVAEVGHCWPGSPRPRGSGRTLRPGDTSTGRWYSRNDGTYWRVWACPEHLEGLVAITEAGWRRSAGE